MRIKIYCKKYSQHTSQIITGYYLMKDFFKSIEVIIDNNINYPNSASIYVVIDDKRKLVYDMADGKVHTQAVELTDNEFKDIDLYFMRSFNKDLNMKLFPLNFQHKLKELPFNYYVTSKDNPMNSDSFSLFLKMIKKNSSFENILIQLMKLVGHNVVRNSGKDFTDSIFKNTIKLTNNPKIIFSTRLWDPQAIEVESEKVKNERIQINKERVAIIERLKKEFPNNFIGGIEYSRYAKKLHPELVLPYSTTKKKNYIKLMKSADICIATDGLHKSIGWKLGEYVAASKCVVHTPFFYEVPKDFKENNNYFIYNNVDELINILHYLISNPKTVYECKIQNEIYYSKYLKPDAIVYNTIKEFL